MKHETIQPKRKASTQRRQCNDQSTNQAMLQGLPCRFHPHGRSILKPAKDWYATLLWLRVPLLLLGLVGALGLWAKHNPRFAEVFSVIRWPQWLTSITLLCITGGIILFLVLDWMYGKVKNNRYSSRPTEPLKRVSWRTH